MNSAALAARKHWRMLVMPAVLFSVFGYFIANCIGTFRRALYSSRDAVFHDPSKIVNASIETVWASAFC